MTRSKISHYLRMVDATRAASVFMPFAAGYFLSYMFRTINGTIAEQLVRTFGLSPNSLGLLTSVYFLTFAALQVPLGVLIDRYGPRRVGAVLMVIAGLGAMLFGLGRSVPTLVLGRALIGLGTSGALTTGLKALVIWMPKDRLALVNGLFIMCGGLGASAATEPVRLALRAIDWHVLFILLSVSCLAIAAALHIIVPEEKSDGAVPDPRALVLGLRNVYLDARFWRIAPLSASVIGTAFSVQSLWAARWMADVSRFSRADIVAHLFIMGLALTGGAALIGAIGNYLRQQAVPPGRTFGMACGVFVIVQLLLLGGFPFPAYALWAAFAVFGGMTVLSYAILAEMFPPELIGRANGALNVLHLGMAFVIQAAMGAVVNLWAPGATGHYPMIAYQAAFALPLMLELAALLWFVRPGSIPERVPEPIVALLVESPMWRPSRSSLPDTCVATRNVDAPIEPN